ncbi:MAG: phosphatidylglycerophosphatase A [Fidelibacterota bacterium]|nr:MAG: phosphatidylglycerophosphatase A [Candidatus Neomarinimicrobiota bacterium]
MKALATFIGTFGFVGYLKPAPGTWGSLAAAVLWWFILATHPAWCIMLVILATAAGICSAGIVEHHSGQSDPSVVVIDEVAGMWLALLFGQRTLWYLITAFIIFRLLDIFKPGPLHRLQTLPGGWGVMMDDLAAGTITLVIMLAIRLIL